MKGATRKRALAKRALAALPLAVAFSALPMQLAWAAGDPLTAVTNHYIFGKFYSSLSTFFCKLFIFFVERMTENCVLRSRTASRGSSTAVFRHNQYLSQPHTVHVRSA